MHVIYQTQNTWNLRHSQRQAMNLLSNFLFSFFQTCLLHTLVEDFSLLLAAASSVVTFFLSLFYTVQTGFYVFIQTLKEVPNLVPIERSSIRGDFLRSQCAAYPYFWAINISWEVRKRKLFFENVTHPPHPLSNLQLTDARLWYYFSGGVRRGRNFASIFFLV